MRRISFGLVMGLALCACGGGEEAKAPTAPTPPVASASAAPAASATEAPKEEAKLSPADAAKKTMADFGVAMAAHDAKKLASFFTDSAVVKIAGMPDITGKDAIAAHFQKMFDAMPTSKGMATRIWMKNDVAVLEWAMAGTHSGDFMGVKATEKPVGLMGVELIWFTPEGLIKEQHGYSDGGTIMGQIGLTKQKVRPVPQIQPGAPPQVVVSTGAADEQKNVDAANKMMAGFEKKSDADFLAGVTDETTWDDMTQAETMKGKDAAKKYFKMMTTAFPDGKMTEQNVMGIGDFVIAEGTFTGTQKGALGPIAATKKPVSMHGVDIIQFKDGKVVKGWSYGNSVEMMMQLGLMPQPGDAKGKADAKAAAGKADAKAPAAKAADAKPAADKKPADKK